MYKFFNNAKIRPHFQLYNIEFFHRKVIVVKREHAVYSSRRIFHAGLLDPFPSNGVFPSHFSRLALFVENLNVFGRKNKQTPLPKLR